MAEFVPTVDRARLRQMPFWVGVAFTVGFGTALVTGQAVAHAEPSADSSAGSKTSASAGPAKATAKPRSAVAGPRNAVAKVPAAATVQTVSARTVKIPVAEVSSARITLPAPPPQVRALLDGFVTALRRLGQTLAANDGPDPQGGSPRTGTGGTPSTPPAVIGTVVVYKPGDVVLSPDGKTAYTTTTPGTHYLKDGYVAVIDTATNTITKTIKIPRDSNIGDVLHDAQLAISPDGKRLYVLKNGGRVAVVDTTTGTVTAELKAGAQAIDISPDGNFLWVSRPFEEQGVTLWDLGTNTRVKSFTTGSTFDRNLITVTNDGFHAYVNGTYNVQLVTLDVIPYPGTVVLQGDKLSLTLNPDGTRLYVGDRESESEMDPPFRTKTWGMIRVVDTATNKVIQNINVKHIPTGVVFSPDGTRVYIGFANSPGIAVMDTATNTIIGTIDAVNVRTMTLSPDGSRLYVSSGNSIVVVSTATVTPVA
ncbi:YVTN family beta-propeller protein [Mycobacterium sp. BK086]|nr:YVTN family beta-propeller protein [Mycobacterium sp. BK086]